MFYHVLTFSFPPTSWTAAEETYAILFTSASSYFIRDYWIEIQNRREISSKKKSDVKRITKPSLDCQQIVTSRGSTKLKTFCSVIKLFGLPFSSVFFHLRCDPENNDRDTRWDLLLLDLKLKFFAVGLVAMTLSIQQIFATAPLSWQFTIAPSREAIKIQLALRLFISLALISIYLHKVMEHHVSSTRITLYELRAADKQK